MYKSCSAFAPIANPSNCPWGEKAFKGYFGEDQKAKWAEHDATELVKKWKGPLELLIDVVSDTCLSAKTRLFAPCLLLYCADTSSRALATTSTSRNSYCQRTLWTLPNRPATTRASSCACSQTTTTVTSSWPPLQMTMSTGPQIILAHSKCLVVACFVRRLSAGLWIVGYKSGVASAYK